MKIVSACLAGYECNYNGEANPCPEVIELVKQRQAVPVCPEQLAGLPARRDPAEQRGDRVFAKTSRVAEDGSEIFEDITVALKKGAQIALKIALITGCDEAILKARSPSCGCGQVYDGSFSGKLIEGDGVFTEALKSRGIKVSTEEDLKN
jgi:uncharacterized protein YbbK (DUF523 family)